MHSKHSLGQNVINFSFKSISTFSPEKENFQQDACVMIGSNDLIGGDRSINYSYKHRKRKMKNERRRKEENKKKSSPESLGSNRK